MQDYYPTMEQNQQWKKETQEDHPTLWNNGRKERQEDYLTSAKMYMVVFDFLSTNIL